MYIDLLTGVAWRFHVDENTGTILRGRAYRLSEDYAIDNWQWYWDADQMVAVYDDPRYHSPTRGNDETHRVEHAIRMAREYDQDVEGVLARLAPRITHTWGHPQPWKSGFVAVSVDYGTTLYALMWDVTDAEHVREWRDEIEAVYHGDVWRIEVEEYQPGMGPGGSDWVSADEICEEWYGEDKVRQGWEREFPLDKFPAETLVSSDN